MDGVPIFSLFDEIPAIHLQGFHGILNSTTNVILSEMEQGLTFDEALEAVRAANTALYDAKASFGAGPGPIVDRPRPVVGLELREHFLGRIDVAHAASSLKA